MAERVINFSAIVKILRIYFVPALALFGFISALRAVTAGSKVPPVAIPIAAPPKAPFDYFVAGAGLVEASTENISIATQIGGVVQSIPVIVGQQVVVGDPLFTIDTRAQSAKLATTEAQLIFAKAKLSEARALLGLIKKVNDMRAVSEELLVQRNANFETATAEVARAEAAATQERVELERLTVRAPVTGTVLQIKTRIGEYAAAAQANSNALMVVGTTTPLHVRVDIDENDSWRLKAGAAAQAFLRGNSSINLALEFVRFEPYIIPKRSLTGESIERVDTRVFQAVYRIVGESPPVFVGQLLDVYVQAESIR